jgi:integrase
MDRTLFWLMLRCGLRVSEVVQLKVSDMDWTQQALRIEQGKGRKDRRVYLSADAVASVRECVQRRPSGHCQLNRTPLYSLRTAWQTCAMKAAPRVRSARFSSNGISLWSCYEPLYIDQPLQTSSVSG